jgi:hypothetical protein
MLQPLFIVATTNPATQRLNLRRCLLLGQPGHVLIDIDREPAVRWPFLFYTIIKNDFNADGLPDDENASTLFVSDRGGRQLRQLTLDGAQLKRRQLLTKTSLLLLKVRPATNKDRKFTPADGSYWLRLDPRDLESGPVRQPAPALSNALRQQMIERQSR